MRLATHCSTPVSPPPGLLQPRHDLLQVHPTRRRYPLLEFLRASPLLRSDIAFNSPGVPLTLAIELHDGWGHAIQRAAVYIWHYDARCWTYDATDDELGAVTMMRGVQISDANGCVQFQTIYPGRYRDNSVPVYLQVYFNDGRHVVSRTDACLLLPERCDDTLDGLTLAPLVPPGARKPSFNAQGDAALLTVNQLSHDEHTGGLLARVPIGIALHPTLPTH